MTRYHQLEEIFMEGQNCDGDGAYYMGGVNNGRELGMGDFKCAACMNEMVLTDFFCTDYSLENQLDKMDENENDFEVLEVVFTDEETEEFEETDEW